MLQRTFCLYLSVTGTVPTSFWFYTWDPLSKACVVQTLSWREQKKYFIWLSNISTSRLDFVCLFFCVVFFFRCKYNTLLMHRAFPALFCSAIPVLLCSRFLVDTLFHWADLYMVWSDIFLKGFVSHSILFCFFFRWNELGGCVVSTGRLQVLR